MFQKGRRRRRDLREYIREDYADGKSLTEREARGPAEEGDQEATAVARPDQDMGSHGRDQGQKAAAGPQETHRDSTLIAMRLRDID